MAHDAAAWQGNGYTRKIPRADSGKKIKDQSWCIERKNNGQSFRKAGKQTTKKCEFYVLLHLASLAGLPLRGHPPELFAFHSQLHTKVLLAH